MKGLLLNQEHRSIFCILSTRAQRGEGEIYDETWPLCHLCDY